MLLLPSQGLSRTQPIPGKNLSVGPYDAADHDEEGTGSKLIQPQHLEHG